MKSVRISKANLHASLQKNLEKHKKNVQELQDNRIYAIAQWMEVTLKKYDSGYYSYKKPIKIENFPEITDNSGMYERAIAMVEMSEDEILELSASEFDQYVLDNWSFKHDLFSTSQFYGKQLI